MGTHMPVLKTFFKALIESLDKPESCWECGLRVRGH